MAMLSVLNFHEIYLRLRGYIWQVFVIKWYLDKHEKMFIFEIDFFPDIKMRNFIITSSENVNYSYKLLKWFCGINLMSVMFLESF